MKEPDNTPDDFADRIVSTLQDKREQNTGSSRRSFLGKSALVGGSLLALGSTAGVTLATEDDHEDDDNGNGTDSPDQMKANFNDIEGTDIDVMNYALTLEHLEYAFYRDHLEMFSEEDFEAAESVQSYTSQSDQSVRDHMMTIRDHEQAHVDVLTQAVTLLGGEPVPEAEYEFGIESVDDFLATARVFERTGVSAYAGAAPFIESPDLVAAAVSIHSVEANHWSLLNDINGESPIPNAFNPPLSQAEVLEAVGPVIQDDAPDDEGTDTEGTDTEGTDTEGTETEGTDTEGTETEGTDTEGTETETTESQ